MLKSMDGADPDRLGQEATWQCQLLILPSIQTKALQLAALGQSIGDQITSALSGQQPRGAPEEADEPEEGDGPEAPVDPMEGEDPEEVGIKTA